MKNENMEKFKNALKSFKEKLDTKIRKLFCSEKKSFKLDKNTINKIVVSILLVIAFVAQIAFLSYLLKGIMPKQDKNSSNALMSYSSKGTLDYKVYLKPNDFISSLYLESGETYILNLIKYIKINSSYNFNSSSKTKVNGSNKFVARLKVYYKESTNKESNPEIMKKEKVLNQKVISFDDVGYSSTNEYDLYLDDYLKILKDFQEQIKISVEGYLEVSSETSLNGEIGGIKYNSSYANVMKIPLSGSVVRIENENPEDKTNYVYENELVKSNKSVMAFIIIANIICFICICFLLKKLFKFTNRTEYDRTISKILKTYDEIIVNTNNILDVDKYSIIEIPEFKEILNLSRELLLPIMNYEVSKGKETWFYVIKDDVLYRFTVKEKKQENTKNSKK